MSGQYNEADALRFEEKHRKVNLFQQRRERVEACRSTANLSRWVRNLGPVWSIGNLVILSSEINSLPESERFIIDGGGIALALAIAVPAELIRRRRLNEANQQAINTLKDAKEDPSVPIPNWVKDELNIEY